MTSLVPALAFSTPAMPPHRPPASAAAPASAARRRSGDGRPPTPPYRPSAVAAMPPTAIWPSPPTLVRLARCAMTKPMPTSASASARLIDAADRIGRAPGAVGEGGQRLRHRHAHGATSSMPQSDGHQHGRHRDRGSPSARRHGHAARQAAALMPAAPPSSRRCVRAPPASAGQWPITGRGRARRCGRPRRSVRRVRTRSAARPRLVAGGADLAVHRLDRADVQAARRLRGEQEDQAVGA